MADATEASPVTYLIIHERTDAMTILYVSSSIRLAGQLEPHHYIGRSPLDFIGNERDKEEFKNHHGSITEDNVIITNIVGQGKDDIQVFTRTIAFICGNVNFHMARSYPNLSLDQIRRQCNVQRFKCILNEHSTDDNNTSSGGMDINTTYSLRTAYQACIVLGRLTINSDDNNESDDDEDAGPKIMFSTDSINRILDVDSSDLQGVPFLSLVAFRDNQKACEYLEKALHSDELVLERLQLLVNPIEESHLRNPRCVFVEFMAMGSDDGIIMLCQLERPKAITRGGGGDDDGYLSLADIISSDPETSDCPDGWKNSGL